MNISKIISALIIVTCTTGLAYYISTEIAVIYVCVIAGAYVAVEQLIARTSLTEGNGQRAARRVHANRRRINFR